MKKKHKNEGIFDEWIDAVIKNWYRGAKQYHRKSIKSLLNKVIEDRWLKGDNNGSKTDTIPSRT